MNKKINTLFFILAATVINIISSLIVFALLFLAFAFLVAPRLSEAAQPWALPVIFVLSICGSFALYHALVKRFVRRVDMGKYFSSLFLPVRRDREE
jgi:predicted permease